MAEYISLDGTHIKVQPPSAITGEVMDTYDKHPFRNRFLDDEAKEMTNANLHHEVASATAASCREERAFATTSASTSQQRRRLEALVKTSLVRFFPQLPNAVFTTLLTSPIVVLLQPTSPAKTVTITILTTPSHMPCPCFGR